MDLRGAAGTLKQLAVDSTALLSCSVSREPRAAAETSEKRMSVSRDAGSPTAAQHTGRAVEDQACQGKHRQWKKLWELRNSQW
eukprot:2827088-Pleurochrysis_carterae.AAC.2